MSEPNIVLRQTIVDGGSAAGQAAIRNLERDIEKLKGKLKEANAEGRTFSKDLKDGLRDIDRFASQMKESIKTPVEKAREEISKLNAAWSMGKLTDDQRAAGMKKINDHLKESTEHAGLFGSKLKESVTDIKSMALGALSVGGAMALVTAQMERQRELRREALNEINKGAASQSNFRSRIPMAEIPNAEAAIDRIRKATGVEDDALETAMPSFLPGQGKFAADALEQAARAQGSNPDKIGPVAEALFKMRTLTKTNDAKSNLGTLLTMAKGSGQETVLTKTIPALTAMQELSPKDDFASNAAFLEALTRSSNDPSGKLAMSVGPKLADKLHDYFPKAGSTSAGLQMLESKPKLVASMFQDLKPRERGVLQQMMTPGTPENQQWHDIQTQYSSADPRQVATDFLTMQAAEPQQQVARADRGIKGSWGGWLKNNPQMAQDAIATEAFDKQLTINNQQRNSLSAGVNWAGSKLGWYLDSTTSPTEFAQYATNRTLENEQKLQASNPSPQHEANIQVLQEILATLQDIRGNQGGSSPIQPGTHD